MSRQMLRGSSGPRLDEEIGLRADRDRTASRVLLTGATGFVGMEVLARLLEETDHDVVCVVRGDAEARLDQVLATLYSDGTPHRDRVTAIPGDLTGAVAAPGPVDVVCHCAASISFDLPLEEARTINVEGTRTMLRVARESGARRFVHVSTAYVSGTHTGLFTEDMLGTEFRNTYEQTKCEAERIVAAEQDGMDVAIARPSIVVGESTTGWTPAFNVLYWPLRAFARGLFETIPARPDGRVDVVPVDYVADGIAALVDSDATGTFNLVAADEAAVVDELATLACAHFGRERPPYVETGASSGAAVDEHGAVYVPYFDMEVLFDDARTRDLLGMRAPRISSYFDTLLDYADRAKWGKRGMPRDRAAAAYAASR